MTPPFPTLHTEANRRALARAAAARDVADQVASFLTELDDALDGSVPVGARRLTGPCRVYLPT